MQTISRLISKVFGIRRDKANRIKCHPQFIKMRNLILSLPTSLPALQTNADGILAVVMESGEKSYVSLLVAVSDGATSFYISNGISVIGSGQYENVKVKHAVFMKEVVKHKHLFQKTLNTNLPDPQKVKFYIITPNEVLIAEGEENELALNQHELSSLFYDAHKLLEAVRVASEIS